MGLTEDKRILSESRITSRLEDELIATYESLRTYEPETFHRDVKTGDYTLQRVVYDENEAGVWYNISQGTKTLSRLFMTKHGSVREHYELHEKYVTTLRTIKDYMMDKLEEKSKRLYDDEKKRSEPEKFSLPDFDGMARESMDLGFLCDE